MEELLNEEAVYFLPDNDYTGGSEVIAFAAWGNAEGIDYISGYILYTKEEYFEASLADWTVDIDGDLRFMGEQTEFDWSNLIETKRSLADWESEWEEVKE